MSTKKQTLSQAGFTIIELMIATTVVSVILLLVTVLMINIGSLYYKGATQARVQDNVRSIMDDITQHMQAGKNPQAAIGPTINGNTVYVICIDSTRYTYIANTVLNQTFGSAPTLPHVFWRDTLLPSGGGCIAADLTSQTPSTPIGGPATGTAGAELMSPASRLTAFCTYGTPPCATPNLVSPFQLTLGVAYGDPSLSSGSGTGTTCNGSIGDQYCATATLASTVVQRAN